MSISEEKIKEYLFQAVQSGKSENSGLVADLTKKITTAVADQVKITVNGKIDDIKKDVADVKDHLKAQDKILNEMKADTDPLVSFKKWLWVFVKGVLWSCGAIVSFGGAWLVIKQILK